MNNSSDKKKKSKKKNKRITNNILILLFLALLLGGGYYYIKHHLERESSSSLYNIDADYIEAEVQDTAKYMAFVIYHENVNINTISNTFYKSNLFWPYIFIENKKVINNPLNIEANTLIKIPRLADTLIDLENTASIRRAKILADSILENVKEPA